MRSRLKTIGLNLFFAHVAQIRVSGPRIYDERHIDERVWCARTITLVGHDGSKYEFGVHSDEPTLPVQIDDC